MDKLLEILSEVRPDVDFKNETKLIDNGILDSLNIMEIIAEISDEFDIELSPADIVPANFNSAESLWAMIQRLQ
mgnify:FL=1|jgi:acyl carrier protein